MSIRTTDRGKLLQNCFCHNVDRFDVYLVEVSQETCMREREKQITPPSHHFHGLYSYQTQLSTNQHTRNSSVTVKFDVRMGFLSNHVIFSWAPSAVPIVLQNIMTRISWLNSIIMLGCYIGYRVDSSHSVILIAFFFLFSVFFLAISDHKQFITSPARIYKDS